MLTHRSFFEPTRKISGNVVEFCSKASSSHCLNNTRRGCETFNVRAFINHNNKKKHESELTILQEQQRAKRITLLCVVEGLDVC